VAVTSQAQVRREVSQTQEDQNLLFPGCSTQGGFHPHQLVRGFKEVSGELESPFTPQLFKFRSEFLLRSKKG